MFQRNPYSLPCSRGAAGRLDGVFQRQAETESVTVIQAICPGGPTGTTHRVAHNNPYPTLPNIPSRHSLPHGGGLRLPIQRTGEEEKQRRRTGRRYNKLSTLKRDLWHYLLQYPFEPAVKQPNKRLTVYHNDPGCDQSLPVRTWMMECYKPPMGNEP